MAPIKTIERRVFYAPTAGRHFFTLKAAARREAAAQIQRKYPSEREEKDEFGRIVDRGWHWADDERLVRVRERLTRKIMRQAVVDRATGQPVGRR